MEPTLNCWWKMTNWTKTLLALAIVAFVGAGCKRGATSAKPPIHPNPNMDSQEKYKAQAEAPFFKNNSSMRMPVTGTVARGTLGKDDTNPYVSNRLGFTIPVNGLNAFYTGRTASED